MAGALPSDEDRLKAIRAHANLSMRYYATAFLRETEENRDLMQAYMAITANILALLDGHTLDDRSMMTGREERNTLHSRLTVSVPAGSDTLRRLWRGPQGRGHRMIEGWSADRAYAARPIRIRTADIARTTRQTDAMRSTSPQ
jgi:hypothetical protein